MGRATAQFFFGPNSWEGVKRSNIIKFQLQSQFQRFVYQTLCVFSQIKDLKHTKWDFDSIAGHAPGVGLWGAGVSKTLAWGFGMVPHRLLILVFVLQSSR